MFTVKCKSLEDYQEVRRAAIEVGWKQSGSGFDEVFRKTQAPRLVFERGCFGFVQASHIKSIDTNFNWDKEEAYVRAFLEEEKTPEILEAYKDVNRGSQYSPLVQEKINRIEEGLSSMQEIQDKLQEYMDSGLKVAEYSFRNEPDGKIVTIKMQ